MKESNILIDMRWRGAHGIGRVADEMYARIPGLRKLSARTSLFNPLDPLLLSMRLLTSGAEVFYTPGFNAPVRERIPIVLTVHDLNYVHCAENSSELHRAYFTAIVRPACRRAFRVLTVSDFSRKQILEWACISEDRVENVGAGVSDNFVAHGACYDPGHPYLLAFCNGRAHKNLALLMQAFVAHGLDRDFRLLVVGELDAQSAVLMRRPEFASKVRVLCRVGDRELASIYRGARALCMPSLFEGFGLPVVEAMACGTPVLAANVTSLPELTAGAAVLVDPRDLESVGRGLREVAFDESLRTELIARGLARSTDFSWARTASQVENVLNQATRKARRASHSAV